MATKRVATKINVWPLNVSFAKNGKIVIHTHVTLLDIITLEQHDCIRLYRLLKYFFTNSN